MCEPGGPGTRDARGGWFGARNRKPSPLDSVSVILGVQPQLTVAWGCMMRERGNLWAWGAWNPGCAEGGPVWRAKPKTEPPGLGIGETWGTTPANDSVGL